MSNQLLINNHAGISARCALDEAGAMPYLNDQKYKCDSNCYSTEELSQRPQLHNIHGCTLTLIEERLPKKPRAAYVRFGQHN